MFFYFLEVDFLRWLRQYALRILPFLPSTELIHFLPRLSQASLDTRRGLLLLRQ